MKKAFSDILDSLNTDRLSRLAAKVPEWKEYAGSLNIPGSLALEQCSSSTTALAKAALIPQEARLADLTGGLGVDCWAFSKVCSRILHNERSEILSEAARHNFEILGICNADFSCEDIKSGNLDFIRGFNPDIIFLDPARRAADGRKVFRLEDCSPDLCSILPELYGICPEIMLKLSPMADIVELGRKLPGLREVRVMGSKGECKELLCLLSHGYEGPVTVTAEGLSFTLEENRDAEVILADRAPQAGELLFEPSATLSKAGCYGILCNRFGLRQIGRDAHLFIGEDFPESGRLFRVLDIFPMGNEGVKLAGKAYPSAEVSARGLKMSSEELKKKLKCTPSANFHIFGAGCSCGKYLICCETCNHKK